MHAAAIEAGAGRRHARARRIAGLYALTPDVDDTPLLVAQVAAALDGGAAAIQYRHKTASAAQRHEQAAALMRLHAARNALFIVNDDAELAAEVGADGVHLGEDDGSIAAARECLGPERLIGVSCYNDFGRAANAVAQGADYVAFGSFFPSPTKPGARRADIALLARARSLGVPVVAIGGIDAGNARALTAAGADAVAVLSDVFARANCAEITAAAAALAACFRAPSSPRMR